MDDQIGLNLSAKKIIAEKGRWWQYELFASALMVNINAQRETPILQTEIMESATKIRLDIVNWRGLTELGAHSRLLIERLTAPISHFSAQIVNAQLAFGSHDHAPNPFRIIDLAQSGGQAYLEARTVLAAVKLGSLHVHLEPVAPAALSELIKGVELYNSDFVDFALGSVSFFENYGETLQQRIVQAREMMSSISSKGLSLEICYAPVINNMDRVAAHIAAACTEQEAAYADVIVQKKADESTTAGYVYLLMNLAMPGLVKVGKTTRRPEDRARELSGATGVPNPFVVVYEIFVVNCNNAEAEMHRQLANYRVSSNREFFRIETPAAIEKMLLVQRLCNAEGPAITTSLVATSNSSDDHIKKSPRSYRATLRLDTKTQNHKFENVGELRLFSVMIKKKYPLLPIMFSLFDGSGCLYAGVSLDELEQRDAA